MRWDESVVAKPENFPYNPYHEDMPPGRDGRFRELVGYCDSDSEWGGGFSLPE
jgi:hypothetical protein